MEHQSWFSAAIWQHDALLLNAAQRHDAALLSRGHVRQEWVILVHLCGSIQRIAYSVVATTTAWPPAMHAVQGGPASEAKDRTAETQHVKAGFITEGQQRKLGLSSQERGAGT